MVELGREREKRREAMCGCERVWERRCVWVCVCVGEGERVRARETVCVCVRERNTVCVSVCERVSEFSRGKMNR